MITVGFIKYFSSDNISEYHYFEQHFPTLQEAEAFVRHIGMDTTIFNGQIV